MYDATFNPDTLRLKESDFDKYPTLQNPRVKQARIKQAVSLAQSGFSSINLNAHQLRNSLIYQTTSIQDDLVLRKAQENVKRITGVMQSNRLEIIKCIKSLCSESVPYRVYKLDIKSFYESIDTDSLFEQLKSDIPSSPSTLNVIGSFLKSIKSAGIPGLPRGLSISAVLSEYYLRRFDDLNRNIEGVFFYARYVDDMILITSKNESKKGFIKSISQSLPDGLNLNYKKTKSYDFTGFHKSNTGEMEGFFDYLGYRFYVCEASKSERDIVLDMSPKKTNRTKTRFLLSIRQFIKDGKFRDLEDRVRILTSNYPFYDHDSHVRRLAGIFYNYRLIDSPSCELVKLDNFIKKIILGKTGKICGPLSLALTSQQRKKLLRYSFQRSFDAKHHFDFRNERLKSLIRCWKYV